MTHLDAIEDFQRRAIAARQKLTREQWLALCEAMAEWWCLRVDEAEDDAER